MINDIQVITRNAKSTEESKVLVKVGSGKAGKAIVIKAQAGATYELSDVIKHRAPDQILLQRKGKDLHILLNVDGQATEKDQPADVIIENYYGEGKAQLIGLAEDGQYYTYLPHEGTVDLLSWNVADGASTYQSLGELHEQVAWLPFVLAGLAAAGAAAGGGGSDPKNAAPVANNDNVTVDEDGKVTLTPLANDTDADGDKLTITSINGTTLTPGVAQSIPVPNGTVKVATDGTITFEPNSNYNGAVTFPYTVSDGHGGTSTANINVTVKPVDDTPVANNDEATTPEEKPIIINVGS